MAKRLTDTEIWEQDWYIDLPNKYKLFWAYIKDKCDHSGIWRPNKGVAQKIIGEPINLDEFLQFVNIEKQRVMVLPSGRWFIKDFFIFQYGDKFSPASQIHKGAIKQLIANGVHPKEILGKSLGEMENYDFQEIKEIAYSKDINILKEAYQNPFKRVKDKDKVKDKEKEKEENTKKAVKFSENGEFAIFEDGSKQKLGKLQKVRWQHGDIKPEEVLIGHTF